MRPVLRFKEFTDNWGMCKLSDVCDGFDYGIGASATDFNGVHKYIRITDIDENSHKYIGNPIVSPDCIPERRYLVNTNDILFARTGASTGKTYLYDEKDSPLYFAGFLIRFNVSKANPSFIFYNTLTRNYNNWIKLTSARSGQPGINSEELKNYSFQCPSIKEQTKIATFLNLYYKKIELQKKKIEQLEKQKQGVFNHFLNNLNNSHTYRVMDVFKITRGLVIPKSNLSLIKTDQYCYPTYSSQTSNNGLLGYSKTFLFDQRCLTWTTDGANAGKVFLRNGKFNCTNVCGVLLEKDEFNGYANNFVEMLLNTLTPNHVSYVGNPKLMNNVMGSIKLTLPSLTEMKTYSNLLAKLTLKTQLEQQKLELLEKYKQGLLQKMFI